MPFCQRCGAEIADKSQPCPACGFQREDATTSDSTAVSAPVPAAAPAPSSVATPIPVAPPKRKKRWPWVVGALGVLFVAATITAGILFFPALVDFVGDAIITNPPASEQASDQSGEQSAAKAETNDPIVGRWQGYAGQADGEDVTILGAAAPDYFYIELSADGTAKLSISEDDPYKGTWTIYTDHDGYYLIYVNNMRWIGSIVEEKGEEYLFMGLSSGTDDDMGLVFVRD